MARSHSMPPASRGALQGGGLSSSILSQAEQAASAEHAYSAQQAPAACNTAVEPLSSQGSAVLDGQEALHRAAGHRMQGLRINVSGPTQVQGALHRSHSSLAGQAGLVSMPQLHLSPGPQGAPAWDRLHLTQQHLKQLQKQRAEAAPTGSPAGQGPRAPPQLGTHDVCAANLSLLHMRQQHHGRVAAVAVQRSHSWSMSQPGTAAAGRAGSLRSSAPESPAAGSTSLHQLAGSAAVTEHSGASPVPAASLSSALQPDTPSVKEVGAGLHTGTSSTSSGPAGPQSSRASAADPSSSEPLGQAAGPAAADGPFLRAGSPPRTLTATSRHHTGGPCPVLTNVPVEVRGALGLVWWLLTWPSLFYTFLRGKLCMTDAHVQLAWCLQHLRFEAGPAGTTTSMPSLAMADQSSTYMHIFLRSATCGM